MVNKSDDNVKNKILESAADVFEEKGLAGARMQQIADKAGINKSLLHYYFRSKDKLFEKVFLIVAKRAFTKFVSALETDGSIFKKIEQFFQIHQELLWKNRNFPIFLINEVNQNPDLIKKVLGKIDLGDQWKEFEEQVEEEKTLGIIRQDVEPIHLLVNIVSLSIFPYIGKPVLIELMGRIDSNYEDFLSSHRKMISTFVINSIKN